MKIWFVTNTVVGVLLVFFLNSICWALEPFECALLVNKNSQDSKELANFYADIRGIPSENMVWLDLPDKVLKPPYILSEAEFKKHIREPVQEVLASRGVQKNVLVWIYSADFPIRIKTKEGAKMSLQGATLVGDGMPSAKAIKKAGYLSPLYRGPGPEKSSLEKSLTFDRLIDNGDRDNLVPSMMLSFTRSRGMSVDETKEMLQRGLLADGSNPRGTIYFVKTDDKNRSEPRHWQFEPVSELLRKSGVEANVTTNFPRDVDGIMGLQTGSSSVKPASAGVFSPGAMAEHLTSWAACFDNPGHTKATAWLKAGATATAGTVTEPYALWPKFPTAFFFYHYRNGATVMESFFASVRTPLQLLMLGDPLARPWMRMANVTVVTLEDGPKSGKARFFVRVSPRLDARLDPKILFYVDGRPADTSFRNGEGEIDTTKISDGYHRLTAVVTTSADMNVKPSTDFGFVVDNKGLVPRLTGVEDGEKIDVDSRLELNVDAGGDPVSIGVRSRGMVLAESENEDEGLEVDPSRLGRGKVPLQVFARYEDGSETRSKPVNIEIMSSDIDPENIVISRSDTGSLAVSGEDGSSWRYRWYENLLARESDLEKRGWAAEQGRLDWNNGALHFDAVNTNKYDLCMAESVGGGKGAIALDLALQPGGNGNPKSRKAGLVFGYEDERNFGFFGLYGDKSAWVLGLCEDGSMKTKEMRGANLDRGEWYRLELDYQDGGDRISASVDGKMMMELEGDSLSKKGGVGLFCIKKDASFRNFLLEIPNNETKRLELTKDVEAKDAVLRVSEGGSILFMDSGGKEL